MPIPDYQSLMLPVLTLAAECERRTPETADLVAVKLGLTDEECEELLPSGKQRLLHNRIHWAKFYLNKAGLINSPKRGSFVASSAGKQLLSTNPKLINLDTLKNYPTFVSFYSGNGNQSTTGKSQISNANELLTSTPEEQIDSAYSVIATALKADLLSRVLEKSPVFFERVIVNLLVAMGYGGTHENAAKLLGKSGDGGVDGVIDEDRLGLDKLYVQAKRYSPHVAVGRPEIQGFVGSLVGLASHKGVFVTTSSFSKQAVDYANNLPHRVILIDGKKLAELMIEFQVGVRVGRTVEVKRIDEEFFSDEL